MPEAPANRVGPRDTVPVRSGPARLFPSWEEGKRRARGAFLAIRSRVTRAGVKYFVRGVLTGYSWDPVFRMPRALARRALGQALDVYRYNDSFREHGRLPCRPLLTATNFALGLSPRILFYPELPPAKAVIYKVCQLSGYLITNDPERRSDLAVKWRDTTLSPRDSVLCSLSGRYRVLNMNCEDISKARVGKTFAAVFGYTASVDPLTFVGRCVRKSNANARHDGQIIDCPLPSRDAECEYQRVLNNEVGDGLVEDIRIPVFRSTIPFAYLKYRSLTTRFSGTNTRAVLAEVEDVLTPEEVGKILRFCLAMGLDYGELDILRDREDHRIYIVDVNSTPWGPPKRLSEEHTRAAVTRLAAAFRETFLSGWRPLKRHLTSA